MKFCSSPQGSQELVEFANSGSTIPNMFAMRLGLSYEEVFMVAKCCMAQTVTFSKSEGEVMSNKEI